MLGTRPRDLRLIYLMSPLLGTAFVFADIFDEYEYHPEITSSQPAPSTPNANRDQEIDEEEVNAALEIPLNTLIECLNIFGTAGGASGPSEGRYRKWRKGDESDDGGDDSDGEGGKGKGKRGGGAGGRGLDFFFGGGSDKRTGMRMSYAGAGHPLVLLL